MVKYIIAAISAIIMAMVGIYLLDKEIEKECSSCASKYDWCVLYWEEKGRCEE